LFPGTYITERRALALNLMLNQSILTQPL
jgi:hypothetical protein